MIIDRRFGKFHERLPVIQSSYQRTLETSPLLYVSTNTIRLYIACRNSFFGQLNFKVPPTPRSTANITQAILK
jgi:hypothetical protein